MRDELLQILNQVASGTLDASEALAKLPFSSVQTDSAVLDTGRNSRCGAPEIVYGQHKSAQQIASAAKALVADCGKVLCTRVDVEKAQLVLSQLEGANYDPLSRCLRVGAYSAREGKVGILSGGTSDSAVVAEVETTLSFLGFAPTVFEDIGIAGLQRLLQRLEDIRECELLIACAGMEGALPSVVAGLVDIPVIGVPTSVGYGISHGGIVALSTMLASCAPGLVVVNIDNGVGAAIAAAKFFARRAR